MKKFKERSFISKFLILFFLILLFISGLSVGSLAYIFYVPNIEIGDKERSYIDIPPNVTTKDSLVKILSERVQVKNLWTLELAFDLMGDKAIHPGHYEIHEGMNNRLFVQTVQRGLQTPIRVTFSDIRTKEQLSGVLSKQLMCDSSELIQLFFDSTFLLSYNLTVDNALVSFIPNTYDFYWSTSAKAVFYRMHAEYNKFWNTNRLEKAKAIPLSPIEVSILASIVEEETVRPHEYPIVAGLYINRLKKGMLLQADPTVKYAVGDMTLRRVLNVHLKIDSPYNTYMNKGLPPGPIRVPSIRTIDAVLNYTHHNYLYMAAKETLNGEHNFAANWAEHTRNAQKYRRALNRRRIYK